MSSLSPGLISSRCPIGGRYRPSAAWNRTRAGMTSPVVASTISTSTRRVGVRSDSMVTAPNRLRAPSAGRRPAGTRSSPTAIVASSVIARSTSVAVVGPLIRERRPPSDDRARSPAGRLERRRRRTRSEHLPEVHADLPGSRLAVDPERAPRLEDQRRGGPAERRDRRHDDAAARIERRERFHPESDDVPGAIRDLDRVEPQRDVAGRTGHRIGHPGLGRPPGARQDPEQAGVSRLGVATGGHRRVRSAPVERCVDRVRDGGEGALAPADDALVHLEPPAHDAGDLPSRRQLHRVAGQRLADGRDPADRQVRRTTRDRVPPGVAEMGDDDVTGRARRAQVDDHLAVEQEPAALGRRAGESERQAAEDLPTGRQPSDRLAIARVEPRAQLAVARIALSPQVDRGREGRRSRRRHRRGPAVVFVRRGTRDHPPRQPALTLSRRYASVRATDCTSHRMHAKAEGHRSVGACATPSGQQPRTDVIMVAPPPWAA